MHAATLVFGILLCLLLACGEAPPPGVESSRPTSAADGGLVRGSPGVPLLGSHLPGDTSSESGEETANSTAPEAYEDHAVTSSAEEDLVRRLFVVLPTTVARKDLTSPDEQALRDVGWTTADYKQAYLVCAGAMMQMRLHRMHSRCAVGCRKERDAVTRDDPVRWDRWDRWARSAEARLAELGPLGSLAKLLGPHEDEWDRTHESLIRLQDPHLHAELKRAGEAYEALVEQVERELETVKPNDGE